MSTEHQQYSTENQADRIKEYAEHHGIEIVHTYADEGKSGLNIGGREGLKRLLEDVRRLACCASRAITMSCCALAASAGSGNQRLNRSPTLMARIPPRWTKRRRPGRDR
jgi:hypothetical protein